MGCRVGIVERRRLSVQVSVVSSASGLDTIQDEWIRLYEQDPRATPWSDPRLLLAFHRMFVPKVRPRVLIARSADGVLRGVLALGMERRRVGPVFTRQLHSLISWHAVFPDAIVDPDHAAQVLPALARAVAELPAESLSLRRVRDDARIVDPDLGFLEELPPSAREEGEAIWSVNLQSDRPFLAGQDGTELRRRLRRLEEHGKVQIGWEESGIAGRVATVEFVSMHGRLKTYQQQTRTFTFGTAADAFPDWLAAESVAGRARLLSIRSNERMLGGVVILRANGKAYSYRVAWEPEFARYGLGILLLTRAMTACRDAGDSDFDLGPGHEAYKNKWQPSIRPSVMLGFDRPTWRGRTANAWLRVRGKR
jgi:CelD/BcsL family acetyltransferase involved in cellulose biosynthesis